MSAIADDRAPNRRTVLRLMASTLAMSELVSCKKADEIVPYVHQPEDLVPGRPIHYATAIEIDGYGFGAIAESHEGRPTKIEGNPDHPASFGAADAIMQAACLSLYDPDRSRTPLKNGEPASWNAFLTAADALRRDLLDRRGDGFVVLAGRITSPTLAWQIERLFAAYPAMRWCRHAPLAASGEEEGLSSLFGHRAVARPHFDRARVIVSLDADFLGEGAGRLAHARSFAGARRLRDGGRRMPRLYVFESMATITGASADHRWPARSSRIEGVARALAARLGLVPAGASDVSDKILDAVATDLRSAGPSALIIAGEHQPAAVHRLAHGMNAALGAFRHTVDYIPS